MVPTGYNQDAADVSRLDQGGDRLPIFPGAGRLQEMDGVLRHSLTNCQLRGDTRVRVIDLRCEYIACMPKLTSQVLLIEINTVLNPRRMFPAENHNRITRLHARRQRQPGAKLGNKEGEKDHHKGSDKAKPIGLLLPLLAFTSSSDR